MNGNLREPQNHRLRLTPGDSALTAAQKMSEGNPGALQVFMGFLEEPDGLSYILTLDTIGIYGSKLYMLWNDCCGRDLNKVKRVLQGYTARALSGEEILSHISDGWGTPFEDT